MRADPSPTRRRRPAALATALLGLLCSGCPSPQEVVTQPLYAQRVLTVECTPSLVHLQPGQSADVSVLPDTGDPAAVIGLSVSPAAATATGVLAAVGFGPGLAESVTVSQSAAANTRLHLTATADAARSRSDVVVDVVARTSGFADGHCWFQVVIDAPPAPPGTPLAIWEPLGGIPVGASPGTGPLDIATLADGSIVVASGYSGTSGSPYSLHRLQATVWNEWLAPGYNGGPTVPSATTVIATHLAVGHDDRHVLARIERSAGDALRVYRFDPAAGWQPLGPALNIRPGPASTVPQFALALDAADNPVVGLVENAAGSSVQFNAYLVRWATDHWQLLPGAGAGDGAINGNTDNVIALDLALDAAGAPHAVVATLTAGTRSLQHVRWNVGTGAFDAHAVSPAGTNPYRGSIVAESDGSADVAWVDSQPGANLLYVTRVAPDGGTTVLSNPALGRDTLNADAAGTADFPRLRRDAQGRIVLAWHERPPGGGPSGIFARRFAAGTWAALGADVNRPTLFGSGVRPLIAIDDRGEPVLTWTQAVDTTDRDHLVGIARWLP